MRVSVGFCFDTSNRGLAWGMFFLRVTLQSSSSIRAVEWGGVDVSLKLDSVCVRASTWLYSLWKPLVAAHVDVFTPRKLTGLSSCTQQIQNTWIPTALRTFWEFCPSKSHGLAANTTGCFFAPRKLAVASKFWTHELQPFDGRFEKPAWVKVTGWQGRQSGHCRLLIWLAWGISQNPLSCSLCLSTFLLPCWSGVKLKLVLFWGDRSDVHCWRGLCISMKMVSMGRLKEPSRTISCLPTTFVSSVSKGSLRTCIICIYAVSSWQCKFVTDGIRMYVKQHATATF